MHGFCTIFTLQNPETQVSGSQLQEGDGVGDAVIDIVGVTDIVGVLVEDSDGDTVDDGVGVGDGVTEEVAVLDTVGVTVGVTDGVLEADDVVDGVGELDGETQLIT
jgi:hypothetical protein